MGPVRPPRDTELVQIVDAALLDATARSGDWLACRPGCTQCCHGVFAISALDAARLRDGLAQLEVDEPDRAFRVRRRAEASRAALAAEFPGDPVTGILGVSEQDQERFAEFANDEPCPALDPSTGTCDLYSARPLTCRIFGPPVLSEDGLGMCDLCFAGASESEMAAAEMHLTHAPLEDELNAEAELASGQHGSTIVTYALLGGSLTL
jgi:Fe-S-cluster containining protein